MIEREQATERDIDKALAAVKERLLRARAKHGMGKYVSIHESLGILTEEYMESTDAAHDDDTEQFVDEMLDVAATGLWAYVSHAK